MMRMRRRCSPLPARTIPEAKNSRRRRVLLAPLVKSHWRAGTIVAHPKRSEEPNQAREQPNLMDRDGIEIAPAVVEMLAVPPETLSRHSLLASRPLFAHQRFKSLEKGWHGATAFDSSELGLSSEEAGCTPA